ncbi:hypothetical protein CEXT_647141 [Caerostris extrusa]|uniref:Uncharacterized protein n=1 Tax=Caerostris extrusa TaxID=172846 RepID=A0AAV4RFJ0_CAEEX|nr:hypothetical protein CEXT_647141 [Caerostris extrusa]
MVTYSLSGTMNSWLEIHSHKTTTFTSRLNLSPIRLNHSSPPFPTIKDSPLENFSQLPGKLLKIVTSRPKRPHPPPSVIISLILAIKSKLIPSLKHFCLLPSDMLKSASERQKLPHSLKGVEKDSFF